MKQVELRGCCWEGRRAHAICRSLQHCLGKLPGQLQKFCTQVCALREHMLTHQKTCGTRFTALLLIFLQIGSDPGAVKCRTNCVYTYNRISHTALGGGHLLSATAGGSLTENTECNNSDIKGSHCMLPLICKFEGRRYKFALLEMRRVVIFGEKVECCHCQRAGSGRWIAGNLSAS